MNPFTLIYDLFDNDNYGLYETGSMDRIAGVVVRNDRDGAEYYEGHTYNVPVVASRPWESLEQFAARLYALYTQKRATKLRANPSTTFDLFAA